MVHILERDLAIQDHFQYYFGNINSSCIAATNVYTTTSTKIHNLKHSES